MFVALTQAGKLKAGPLVTTTRKMPHTKATQLLQCHQDRGTFLCAFTLAGTDMERREPGIQKDNPYFVVKCFVPAFSWETSAGTSCHLNTLMPQATGDVMCEEGLALTGDELHACFCLSSV